MFQGDPYRQVLLTVQREAGIQCLVTWLPTKDLRRGLAVGDMTVATIYELTRLRCPDCQRLCGPDTVRCMCAKK